jgi:hypothetical protein
MATVGQLCTVSALLEKNDIVHVSYKGPVLACYLFDDFAMRSYGDLDILVSAVDLPQVYDKEMGSGFQDIKFVFHAKVSRSSRGRLVLADLANVPTNGGRLNR